MDLNAEPRRFGIHDNAFGFLRLLFASLVIVSHTPEIIDNGPKRELLHRLTGGMTFGSFAVNGFFIISGFLISGSYLKSPSILDYLGKRITRIYPAFVLSSLVCLTIVVPLASGGFPLAEPRKLIAACLHIVLLARPTATDIFPGQGYNDAGAALNGAMWTIQYEFLCYLLVIVIGWAGILRRPIFLMVFAIVLLVAAIPLPDVPFAWASYLFLPGSAAALPRLAGMFVMGAAFYGLRDRLVFTERGMLVAGIGLSIGLCVPIADSFAFALFGGYLIFAMTATTRGTVLTRINNRNDISYGVYLYGWPIERLLIADVGPSIVLVGSITLLLALASGTASWFLVEKPALKMLRGGRMRMVPA